MKILENFIDIYYINSVAILHISILVCVLIWSVGIFIINKNKKQIVLENIHVFWMNIAIACLGILIGFTDLVPEINYAYFNVMIFIVFMFFIIGHGIYQGIIYKKVRIPMAQICKYIRYIVLFEMFLLAMTKHLEFLEWLAGTLVTICVNIIARLLQEDERFEVENIAIESDYPNSDLYYSRELQLEKFVQLLNHQKSEPYAIMISGEWGIGKSSFIKALEEKLDNDSFIWIKAGGEKTVSEIMSEISGQIIDVLKDSNIIVEKEGLIEKYFIAFSGIIEETKFNIINKLIDILGISQSQDASEYLNGKLKELKNIHKYIYLIVDDLDRCDEEYQLKMFKVIRESTQLIQCKTIFLVDRNEFLSGKYKQNNVDKYVNYILDLCKVEYSEIVGYVFETIFDDEFIQGMNSILSQNRDKEKIKDLIYRFPSEVIEAIEKKLSELESNIKGKIGDESTQSIEDEIKELHKTLSIIKKNISNSRRVKNFLKGVKWDTESINSWGGECSQEIQKEDWFEAIIRVQFLKHIVSNIYADVKMSDSILEYEKKDNNDSADIILGLSRKWGNDRRIVVLNYVLYELDVVNFTEVKIERERYLDELHSNNATISNIKKYINYTQTCDDINRVLDICSCDGIKVSGREEVIKEILEIMSSHTPTIREDEQQFYILSVRLVEWLRRHNLTEQEQQVCMQQSQMIVRRVIVDNSRLLKNSLIILLGVNKVEEYWQTLTVADIDEFYTMLSRLKLIDKKEGIGGKYEKLLIIKEYYSNLMMKLRKDKYNDIGLDFEEISNKIEVIFDTCMIWLGLEVSLKRENNIDNTEVFSRYFTVERKFSYKEIAFLNISNLKQALLVLKEFYEAKEENYNSSFSLLLLRITYKIVLIYETEPKWFEGEEREVNSMLLQMLKTVCDLDQMKDTYEKDVVNEIKILVYKFNDYCKKLEVKKVL